MLDFLRRLLIALLQMIGRLLGISTNLSPPLDPLTGVREPRHGSPGGNRSSAAVEEPHEPEVVDAVTAKR